MIITMSTGEKFKVAEFDEDDVIIQLESEEPILHFQGYSFNDDMQDFSRKEIRCHLFVSAVSYYITYD